MELVLAGKRDLQKRSVEDSRTGVASNALQLISTPIDQQIMGKINQLLFAGCLFNRPVAFVRDAQNYEM